MTGTRISGSINIFFDTDRIITQEQFEKFKEQLQQMVNDNEIFMFSVASKCGFGIDNLYPITLEQLYLEEAGED